MASSTPPYELVYYTGVPGRGEHIRLLFAEANVIYSDTGSLGMAGARQAVVEHLKGHQNNPPYYAPPMLKHGDLLISQTSNILMYLGQKFGLAGSAANSDEYRVNALALTALDGLSNEVHDNHHPLVSDLPYEDQKDESIRRNKEWLKLRFPKHLAYWQLVLEQSKGQWLMGDTFTYADIVLFQCIDGVKFAYPNVMAHAEKSGKYTAVFQLWDCVRLRPNIAAYLASDKRQKYDWGIYRNYPESDVVPTQAA
ncbi:hypothetical protein VHEMI06139 [[Torrubiella] hemipterigena]|uniref:Glutathione S-transferase n=1 Tax=[Torrubiella] hemipterigena TaxID=1531966 RepID=A0A0A1TIQ2_9HYPO|nr:hypothetical protein VHEMI06139 [[Torrubiella] hemipterigena]